MLELRNTSETWTPYTVGKYSTEDGGYPVTRLDGLHCATFVDESEAKWFAELANQHCREIGHTGFAEE